MNLLEALVGVNDENVPEIVFGYGVKNEPELVLDYVRTGIFAGNVDKKLLDTHTQALADEFPTGFGFRIEGDSKVDDMGVFCIAVMNSAKKDYNKILKDLDINNPDHEADIIEAQKKLALINGYVAIIKEQCKASGNGLKRDLALHKKNIKIIGDEKGNVKIFVNRFPITKDNPGECILTAENSTNELFEVNGQIRGLSGVAGTVSDKHFLSFYWEDGDLFMIEQWFTGGKPEAKAREYGTSTEKQDGTH